MQIEWPDGVVEIVKEVHAQLKQGKALGPHNDPFENAANEIISRIEQRGEEEGLPTNLGFESDKRLDPKVERILQEEWDKQRNKNRQALDWAKKQCFRLLLLDLHNHKRFVDHEYCTPASQEEESEREATKHGPPFTRLPKR